jgi:hypothetical protein
LYEHESLSLFQTPFRNKEENDYFTACTRCEQRVVIDRSMNDVLGKNAGRMGTMVGA